MFNFKSTKELELKVESLAKENQSLSTILAETQASYAKIQLDVDNLRKDKDILEQENKDLKQKMVSVDEIAALKAIEICAAQGVPMIPQKITYNRNDDPNYQKTHATDGKYKSRY